MIPNLGSRKTLRRLLTMALVVGGAACDGAIGNHGVPTGQGGNGRSPAPPATTDRPWSIRAR